MFSQERPSFFSGKNGSDELTCLLILIAILLWIVYPFFPYSWLRIMVLIVAGGLVVWGVARMFSENLTKRRAENDTLLRFFSHFKKKKASGFYDKVEYDFADKKKEEKKREKEAKRAEKKREKEERDRKREEEKKYKVFECPNCKTKLRVPRGKGKVRITCRNCGEKFEGRT